MTMINTNADSGTLDATGVQIVPTIQGSGFRPFMAAMNSVNANRKIEFSPDGGTTWNLPVYDVDTTGIVAVAFLAPVTHVRFTGSQSDAWRVY